MPMCDWVKRWERWQSRSEISSSPAYKLWRRLAIGRACHGMVLGWTAEGMRTVDCACSRLIGPLGNL